MKNTIYLYCMITVRNYFIILLIMELEILSISLTFVLIISAYIVYVMLIRPKKQLDHYARIFQQKGFKVFKYPFKFMGSPAVEFWQYHQRGNDVLAILKDQYYHYDIILSNFVHNVMIEYVKPSLLQHFYSQEGVDQYYKMRNINEPMKRVLGRGLLTSQGNQWKKKRLIMSKVFNFQLIKQQTKTIAQICDFSINYVENLESTKDLGEGLKQYEIFELTACIFSNVIIQSFVGGCVRDLKFDKKPCYRFVAGLIIDNSNRIFQTLTSIFGVEYLNLGIWESHRQTNRKISLYRNWCRNFIHQQVQKLKKQMGSLSDQQRKTIKPKTVIQALLLQNIDFKEEEMMEQFMVFFIAGTDTTALMLQAMIYEIARKPEIEKKAREQINKYMENDDYSFDNLKNLNYVQCIQKQAIRMYGPVVNVTFREVVKDHYIEGVPIKKGVIINPSIYSNHFNPQYFDRPKEFIPEKWQNQSSRIPSYALGGFGLGPRSCIGKHLAFLECKIALVKILKRYKEINIPNKDFRMMHTCFYQPEHMKSQLRIAK